MCLSTATRRASLESQLPAVFIQSCLSFRKDHLACGEVMVRGADDLRVPLPNNETTDIAALVYPSSMNALFSFC